MEVKNSGVKSGRIEYIKVRNYSRLYRDILSEYIIIHKPLLYFASSKTPKLLHSALALNFNRSTILFGPTLDHHISAYIRDMSTHTQRYTLPFGATSGWVILPNGIRIWVEFLKDLEEAAVRLPDRKEAAEDVAIHAAVYENCDWVRIR